MSSELKLTNIKHPSSGSNNLVLASDGSATIGQISSSSAFPTGCIINVGFSKYTGISDYSAGSTGENFTNVPDLSVTMPAPQSTSSKYLIMVDIKVGGNTNADPTTRVVHSIPAQSVSEVVTDYIGDDAPNRQRVMSAYHDDFPSDHADMVAQMGGTFVHDPTLTGLNAVTYKVQIRNSGNGTCYINRSALDVDSEGEGFRTASGITVMEIA